MTRTKRFAYTGLTIGVGILLAPDATHSILRAQWSPHPPQQQREPIRSDGRLPAGVRPTQARNQESIRQALAEVAVGAVGQRGLDELVGHLVQFDRNRLDWYVVRDFPLINSLSDQIRSQWRDMYGSEFALDPRQMLGPSAEGLRIVQGEVEDPVEVASEFPVPPVPLMLLDEFRGEDAVALRQSIKDPDMWNPFLEELPLRSPAVRNLERGRQIAVARLAAQADLPPLAVSLIRESDGWRIDIPDWISGPDLRRSLLSHLLYLSEHMNELPEDESQARHVIAHHVLMAAYNLEMPEPL